MMTFLLIMLVLSEYVYYFNPIPLIQRRFVYSWFGVSSLGWILGKVVSFPEQEVLQIGTYLIAAFLVVRTITFFTKDSE